MRYDYPWDASLPPCNNRPYFSVKSRYGVTGKQLRKGTKAAIRGKSYRPDLHRKQRLQTGWRRRMSANDRAMRRGIR